VQVRRQPADVPAVAHRDERQDGDLRVLGRVQRAEQDVQGEVLGQHPGLELVPQRAGRERRRREVEDLEVEDLVGPELLALVGHDLLVTVTTP
jgi:hypothetical protein